MKQTLLTLATALLLSGSQAIATSSIPQISDYSIPAFAYTVMSRVVSWSSEKNQKNGPFSAIDAAIGLYGTYAIDTSYAVWNYSTLTGAKSASWNSQGISATKIVSLLTGDIAWIDKNGAPQFTILGSSNMSSFIQANSSVPFTAVDIGVSLSFEPTIITNSGKVWTFDLTKFSW